MSNQENCWKHFNEFGEKEVGKSLRFFAGRSYNLWLTYSCKTSLCCVSFGIELLTKFTSWLCGQFLTTRYKIFCRLNTTTLSFSKKPLFYRRVGKMLPSKCKVLSSYCRLQDQSIVIQWQFSVSFGQWISKLANQSLQFGRSRIGSSKRASHRWSWAWYALSGFWAHHA